MNVVILKTATGLARGCGFGGTNDYFIVMNTKIGRVQIGDLRLRVVCHLYNGFVERKIR